MLTIREKHTTARCSKTEAENAIGCRPAFAGCIENLMPKIDVLIRDEREPLAVLLGNPDLGQRVVRKSGSLGREIEGRWRPFDA